MVRGALFEAYKEGRDEGLSPIDAWSNIQSDPDKRTAYQVARGKGGLRRVSWDEALEMMAQGNIGAILVTQEDKVVGIFSERDYARKVVLEGKASKETPVSDLMSDSVLFVTPEHTIDECMALMTDKRARHLPVVDQKRVVGVVSIGDLVKTLINEQQILIDQLQHYISG